MPSLASYGKAKPNFMSRIQNPSIYPVINNKDGSISTHRMAAEIDEDGKIYAFPTIVQMPDGKLHQFDDNYEALNYNKSIGNVLPFDNLDDAIKYSSGGYKTEAFKDFYNGKPKKGLKLSDFLKR